VKELNRFLYFTVYLRVHFLFQPNCLGIFFYSLIAFGLIRFIQSSENKWLYVTEKGTAVLLLTGASEQFIKFYNDKLNADRLKTTGF